MAEEKGFTIKDKRFFTSDERPKEEPKASEKKTESAKKESVPLPEVSFSSFILSLSSSALLHFGEIPDPVTNKKEKNLPMAKQTIDILAILKEKTKGNLTKDEEALLDNILYDLRLRYVAEVKKG